MLRVAFLAFVLTQTSLLAIAGEGHHSFRVRHNSPIHGRNETLVKRVTNSRWTNYDTEETGNA